MKYAIALCLLAFAAPCCAQYGSGYGYYNQPAFVPYFVPVPYIPYKSAARQARYQANREHARIVRLQIVADREKRKVKSLHDLFH